MKEEQSMVHHLLGVRERERRAERREGVKQG